jgi:uncharacterized protein
VTIGGSLPALRNLLAVLLLPLGVYASLCLLLYLTQRSQIYFPVPEAEASGGEAARIAVDGAELKLWTVTRPGPKALLYFGGNAEDVGAGVAAFSSIFPGHTLYFVNYRGYGGSSGSPTEAALVADAVALYDSLRPRHRSISVLGRSLGSGVAIQLAAVREIDRLVLLTPFDSLVTVARAHFPWIPVALLLRDRYDSASLAHAVRADTLVVVAGSDEIVPRASSDALVAAFAPGRARVVVLDGAGHNEIDESPRFRAELARFLDS